MEQLFVDAGLRIEEMRILRNFEKEEFARRVGISARYLYNIEHGKQRFTADTLFRISQVLNVSCDYILSGRDAKIKNKEIIEIVNLFEESQMASLVKVLKGIYAMGNSIHEECIR